MIQEDLAQDWPDGHVGSRGLFLLQASEDNSNVWLSVPRIHLYIPITIFKKIETCDMHYNSCTSQKFQFHVLYVFQ